MEALLKAILQMSLTASYVAVAVIVARLFLKKAPKIFSYLLWSVVLFRLVCPFPFTSMFSLLPQTMQTNTPSSIITQTPFLPNLNIPPKTTPILPPSNAPIIDSPVLPPTEVATKVATEFTFTWDTIIGLLWIVGIVALLSYCFYSYLKLNRKLRTATKLYDNIYESDCIQTPFVLGFIKPKIYLPLGISEAEQSYIIKHEQTHIRRLDYWIKPIAFLVLILHWFNPLLWICFILMTKDMEMSCDEAVMKSTQDDIRGSYSTSLLSLSIKQNGLFVPLAFGESSVKSRIKNVLSYKKPAFWIIIVSVLVLIGVTIGLVSNPKEKMSNIDTSLFEDINSVRIANLGKDKVVEFTSANDYNYIIGLFQEMKMKPAQNLQSNNLENKLYQITINSKKKEPIFLTINLNKGCGYITISDNEKPNVTYIIQNSSKFQESFEQRFLQIWNINQPKIGNDFSKNTYTAYIYTENNQKDYKVPLTSEMLNGFTSIVDRSKLNKTNLVEKPDEFSLTFFIPTDNGFIEYSFMKNSFSVLNEGLPRKFYSYGNEKDKKYIKDFVEFTQSLDSSFANPKVPVAVPVDFKKVLGNVFVSETPYILYADSEKIVFESTIGLVYYDIKKK